MKSDNLEIKGPDADRVTSFTPEQKSDEATFLKNIGFNPSFWELIDHKQSTWEQKSKLGDKLLSSCKISIKPRVEPKFDPKEFAKEVELALKI